MSIYSDPNGGVSAGHAFVVITNSSDETITVGAYTLEAGASVSVGTFGNKDGNCGIWYNLEASNADWGGYDSYVSLTMSFGTDQLGTINKFIGKHDDWTLYQNCSYFAAGVWNSISDT